MTRSPLGSVEIWYGSFGGRTAACTGVNDTAATSAASTNNAARVEECIVFDYLTYRLEILKPVITQVRVENSSW